MKKQETLSEAENKRDEAAKRERDDRHKRLRKAYKKSGMKYDELAVLLGVKRNTLANWLSPSARRVPPEYVVGMIEKKVNDFLKSKKKKERKNDSH